MIFRWSFLVRIVLGIALFLLGVTLGVSSPTLAMMALPDQILLGFAGLNLAGLMWHIDAWAQKSDPLPKGYGFWN